MQQDICDGMYVLQIQVTEKKSGDADAVGWRLAYTTLQDSLFVPRLL